MNPPLSTIAKATKRAIASSKQVITFVFLAAGLWFLFIMVPVWTTPGNDFLFQLSITHAGTHALMIALAVLNALLLMMHLYIRKHHKGLKEGVKSTGHSLGSIGSALIATIGCASCYSSIISVFGIGTVTFIGEYRWLLSLIALSITFTALYLTANRIENGCNVCSITL